MKNRLLKRLSACCAAVMAVSIMAGVSASAAVEVPDSADNTVLYWATKIGEDPWVDPPSPVVLSEDGYLYFSSLNTLYKMDEITGETVKTGEMVGQSSYATTAPLVADGMVFVGLDNGKVQAFDADTLESLWVYTNEKGGSSRSSITYDSVEKCIYTGFWINENYDADFVCIDTKDEDTANKTEDKAARWEYTSKGGFYWTGAYCDGDYTVIYTEDGVGSDDWSVPNFYGDGAGVVTLDKKTGEEIDHLTGVFGDIRSKTVYDEETDRYYFTSKGGIFGSVKIDAEGKISDYKYIDINKTEGKEGLAMTSTPAIANGRAYIGVNGTGWDAYNGSHIAVIDLDSYTLAYTAETAAAPQASGVILNYENDDYNYVYFIENNNPSKIRLIKDKKGVTEVIDPSEEQGHICAPAVFTPQDAQAEYCAVTPDADYSRNFLLFKNDSAYIMAVGPAVDSLEFDSEAVWLSNENGRVLLFKEGEKVTDYRYLVSANGGLKADVTEDVTLSLTDELTLDDDLLTVTYSYGVYTGSGSKAADVSEDVDLLVVTEEEYDNFFKAKELIGAIGTVTLESGEDIEAARAAYDAVSDKLREYLDRDLAALEEAEAEYAALKENENNDPQPQDDPQPEDNKDPEKEPETKPDNTEPAETKPADTAKPADTKPADDKTPTSGLSSTYGEDEKGSTDSGDKNSSKDDSSKADDAKAAAAATNANPATGAAAGSLALTGVFAAFAALRNKKR